MFSLFSRKQVAHMGEENKLYYNEELKRWVERGKEHEAVEDTIPPPPVAASGATTQKTVNHGDPASRYVVAGGFRRNATPQTESVKTFATPPRNAATAPPTGGFFVPAMAETVSEGVTPETSASEKYKGFRIPKFEKPVEVEGTQTEYEAREVEKWKAMIDRKEAAKKIRSKGSGTPKHQENGIDLHARTGSGKLENNWLMENGTDNAFDEQSFMPTEEMHQQDAVAHSFATDAYAAPASLPQYPATMNGNESDPLTLFAVEPERKEETGQTSDQPSHNPMSYPYAMPNEATEWSYSDPQATYANPVEDEPINFDTWGNPEENELLAQTLQDRQLQPEPTSPVEDVPPQELQAEGEYPGAIRESDDPFDVTWLTKIGWTDLLECQAITLYMCQTYQDLWRSWHKDDPQWHAFWAWYYDGGYEIIHATQHDGDAADQTQNAPESNPEDQASFFSMGLENDGVFNKIEDQQLNGEPHVETAPQYSDSTQEDLSPRSQRLDTVPEEAEMPIQQDVPEQAFVCDEDVWNIEEVEGDVPHDPSLNLETVIPEAPKENIADVPIKEPVISCPDSSGKESTKLPSWEDELLFSLPDPWVDVTSSEDGTDDGKLPFAIFSHDGMQHFLMKLDSFLTELSSLTTDLPSGTAHFRHQVKELIKAVEVTGHAHHGAKPIDAGETESLREELELRTQELASLRYQFTQGEAEWNNKLEAAQEEAVQIQEAYTSMEISLKEQEIRMHNLVAELGQAESELTANKKQLADITTQLQTKEDQLKHLTEEAVEDKTFIQALRDQLKDQGREFIQEDASKEIDDLKKEMHSLQTQLAERTEDEIGRLTDSSQGNGVSINNNETGEFLEKLKDLENEVEKAKQLLLLKDSTISELEKELQLKSVELEALSHISAQLDENESDYHLASEFELLEQRYARLENDLNDKDADFQRLSGMLESLQQKDAVISKLTAIQGEKDQELLHLRSLIAEGRQRESNLIDTLAAKDVDLENVVRSLMFSQKQVSRLCGYCTELGGDPHSLLSTLQVVE